MSASPIRELVADDSIQYANGDVRRANQVPETQTAVLVQPTQVRRPWRSTVRTAFQGLLGAAAMAAPVYEAATHHDPAAATGFAATGLAIAAGVTRVMALPVVEAYLRRFLPFLAAAPDPTKES